MMNKRQKIVEKRFLNNEEAVLNRLGAIYGESLTSINKKISKLDLSIGQLQDIYFSIDDDDLGELAETFFKSKRIKVLSPSEAKETLQTMIQSKVYQKEYQQALKKQVDGILDTMHEKEFKTISDYLSTCYDDGFVGTLFDLQGQGIPLCFPLDQEAMVRAVQLDSKISQGLYRRLGEDIKELKKKITSTVSRGISTGMTYQQMAKQLEMQTNIGYNRAARIARTEGHRIQGQSKMDACYKAKEKGADVVKKWDAILDNRTRESHAFLDGEIRELDEKFSNGLMFPGDPSGAPEEVINCRCILEQRARWALQSGFTKMNSFTKQLETFEGPEDYAEFKKTFFSKENKEYMDFVEDMEEKYGTKDFRKVLDQMSDKEYAKYTDLTKDNPVFNKRANSNKILTNSGKSSIILDEVIKGTFVPDTKLVDYALHPVKSNGKAQAFKEALGYDQSNFEELKQNILDHLDESLFVEKGDSGYGMRYECIMELTGANGKKANVLTAWIQEGAKKRLTSLYVTKRKVTK